MAVDFEHPQSANSQLISGHSSEKMKRLTEQRSGMMIGVYFVF